MRNGAKRPKGKDVKPGFAFVISSQDFTDPNEYGFVTSFTVNAGSGKLTKKGQVKAGRWVRNLVVHPSVKFLFVASLVSDDILAYSIKKSDGTLTPVTQPVKRGGDSIAITPDGKFIYATGDTDKIFVYAVDENTGLLTEKPSPSTPGLKPYGVTMMPSGKLLYVLDEASENIFGFTIENATGVLTPISGSPFPRGKGRGTLIADPLNRFLFVANYDPRIGQADLWSYKCNGTTGGLVKVGLPIEIWGTEEVGMAITPTGTFIYSTSGQPLIDIIKVNQTTGTVDRIKVLDVGNLFPFAACVDPSGKFLYTANVPGDSSCIALYKIAIDGQLKEVKPPTKLEPQPSAIVITKRF